MDVDLQKHLLFILPLLVPAVSLFNETILPITSDEIPIIEPIRILLTSDELPIIEPIRISPNFENITTTTPHFENRTTTTPHFENRTTTTPHIENRTTTTPHFGNRTTTTPHFENRTTTTPHFENRTTTTPHFENRTTTTPHFENRTTTTPHFENRTTTSPHFCTSVYVNDFNKDYRLYPTPVGEATLSKESCITDSKPLVTGLCVKENLTSVNVINITVNPNCFYLLNLTDTSISPIGNLSKEIITESNAADIAKVLANLTSPGNDLDANDVIFTSMIMTEISNLESVDEEVVNSAFQTVLNIMALPDSELQKSQSLSSSTNRILQAIEQIAIRTNITNNTLKIVGKNLSLVIADNKPGYEIILGIQLENIDNSTKESTSAVILTNKTVQPDTTDVGIYLPEDLVKGAPSRSSFLIYRNTKLFQTRIKQKEYIINSYVVSGTLLKNGIIIENLDGNVVTTVYRPLQAKEAICGFWNYSLHESSGGWSTEGCEQTGEAGGRVICHCDHLTNFAILIDVKGQTGLYDISHRRALSVITVIGLSLSITGLGITAVSFILFKHLRNGRSKKTFFNLVLALLFTLVVFVAGIDQTESYGGCIVVAVMMHYLLLVTFMWMFVEGFLQYLNFVRVLDTYIPKFMLKASIVAWGAPSIPVIIVLAVDYDLYKGGNYYCWMSRQPFYFAFLLPIAIIVLGNCIVFALVLKHLLARPKGLRSNQSEKKRMVMNIRASISIFVLLGLSWVFGILAIEDARLVFSYIFTILTTLQGFFIFVLFVARNKHFRNSWKNFFAKRQQFRNCWGLFFSRDEMSLQTSTMSLKNSTDSTSSAVQLTRFQSLTR